MAVLKKMNRCKTYLIECPYALRMWDELPCIGTEVKCDIWRKKYEQEHSLEYRKAVDIAAKHPHISFEEKVKLLKG